VTDVQIVVEKDPDPALRDAIVKTLQEYNAAQVGPIKPEPVAISLRDDTGTVIGGLWGRSVADWVFVDLLVVPDGLRGKGIGTLLMQKAEDIARQRRCIGIWLYTATFQAPSFYEKLGFTRFGELPDYPKGHTNFYYAKRLDDGC
jgi:ribosomal protein S18 acetylase RimI-like enzyme